ncbi:hypothetical protein PHSY_000462 [Pseudozyma hubeiensis SY62]|uniref:Uncharacterized protein n=1 Tax=Pseudozyma hubeiensis (strain SY62) TaxID=1305764 RepID=R9NWE1_PSEHS|nr:hypothetical protein PHSY_000462 [Pseudozyma hubeiensis SY62]GAC92903.1 hypothetical protein PHSY_000462 [Pseudozyma hubeiensis SY62]
MRADQRRCICPFQTSKRQRRNGGFHSKIQIYRISQTEAAGNEAPPTSGQSAHTAEMPHNKPAFLIIAVRVSDPRFESKLKRFCSRRVSKCNKHTKNDDIWTVALFLALVCNTHLARQHAPGNAITPCAAVTISSGAASSVSLGEVAVWLACSKSSCLSLLLLILFSPILDSASFASFRILPFLGLSHSSPLSSKHFI